MNTRYRRILSQLDAAPPPRRRKRSLTLTSDQTRVLLDVVRQMNEEHRRDGDPKFSERRHHRRRPYPQRILLTPCLTYDLPRFSESEAVVARDLSISGLSFVRARHLSDRRHLVTFPGTSGLEPPLCMAAELRHQSAARQGLYLIGIRFVQRVSLCPENSPYVIECE